MTDVAERPNTPIPVKPLMVLILHARGLESRLEDALRSHDLSIRKLGLLGHLLSSPGISFSDLARRAGIRVQSLQPIVSAMIDDNLVRTVGSVGQGRAAVLELTDVGRAALREASAVISQIEDDVFADDDWAPLAGPLAAIGQAEFRRMLEARRSA